MRADYGLLSAVDAAGELDAGDGCRRRRLLESAAGKNERKAEKGKSVAGRMGP